ncbi:MAG: proline racemase [bacterium]|jgi:trans-L-3-hydroxyproline dehydratase|nr:proline racemase [Candidatus Aquidulcis sp.]
MNHDVPHLRLDAPPAAAGSAIEVLDYHTAGEPFRIVVSGYPELAGTTILERRRSALQQHDHLRKMLMWEPRGHADMYGGILVPPDHDEAQVGVLFMHNEGYSTMCGHGTIALATALVESGAITATGTETPIGIDAPCGLVRAVAHVRESELAAARAANRTPRVHEVSFENVPSFAAALNVAIEVPGYGSLTVDVGYGGAFYALIDAAQLGIEMRAENAALLAAAGRAITDAGRAALHSGGALATALGVSHPEESDLSFLYGTIISGPPEDPSHHSRNLCLFAEGEVDRSPTGSGVSARLAVLHARGAVATGEEIAIESILGRESVFHGRVARTETWAGREAVIPEVRGSAHMTGSARFVLDDNDLIGRGFLVAR